MRHNSGSHYVEAMGKHIHSLGVVVSETLVFLRLMDYNSTVFTGSSVFGWVYV